MDDINERETSTEPMGAAKGSGTLSADDSRGDGSAKTVSGGCSNESGGLPRIPGETANHSTSTTGGAATPDEASAYLAAGKVLGQWVAKNLEYQLAYHSSSIDWYQVEIDSCQSKIRELEAEIIRYEGAIAWHRHYHQSVDADLRSLITEEGGSDE